MSSTSPTVAFISGGKLFVASASAPPAEVPSAFLQRMLDRIEQDRSRGAWKDDSFGWNFTARGPMAKTGANLGREARFTSVALAAPGEVLYSLESDAAGGLFHMQVTSKDERRMFHKQDVRISDIAVHPVTGMIALSLRNVDGTSHLGLMNPTGGGLRPLTEGDVIDGAPSWSPSGGTRGTLLYHSAGIARAPQGHFSAVGPNAVHELNLDTDELSTLLESETLDYLTPRKASDGSLYYIQRPYYPFGAPPSRLGILKDIILFPVRLGTAVVHFLNIFSVMFSRKPLITSGGPPREGLDQRQIMLWGKMMDAEKALRENRGEGGIVPKDWRLIRRDAAGKETTLSESVVAFDIAADGGVVWTNGSTIYHQANGAPRQEIASGKMIERLTLVL
ncbi:MAG: hypothetical protein WC718_07795 [Phycisphaerales bacterium]|jgi:hypothetical protein